MILHKNSSIVYYLSITSFNPAENRVNHDLISEFDTFLIFFNFLLFFKILGKEYSVIKFAALLVKLTQSYSLVFSLVLSLFLQQITIIKISLKKRTCAFD